MEGKAQLLESVPLLASLGDETIAKLAEVAEFTAHKKNEIVLREGEDGNGLYVVVSGRLHAYSSGKTGGERVFARYCGGDWFGEMPLLGGVTNWASVRTLNDSVLLKIPRAAFEELLLHRPQLAKAFTSRMAERLKQVLEDRGRADLSTIISLFSAVPGAGKTLLATNLVASLARETGEPVLLLDFTGRRGGKALAQCRPVELSHRLELDRLIVRQPHGHDQLNLKLTGGEREGHLIAPLFGALVKRYKFVLVDLPNQTGPSVFESMIQSDQIYVVAKNEDEHLAKTRLLLEDLRNHEQLVSTKARVILTAVGPTCVPYVEHAQHRVGQGISYLLRWISNAEIIESVDGAPYVLRRPMEPYSVAVRRIAREMGNVQVGLVFSAGGARGLAHIGVLRVLEREGISVDVVAGSSMGALVAGAWATGRTADELEAIAMQIKGRRAFLKLLSPVFPGAGVVRGYGVTKFLRSIVDDLTFDDTVIPVRIVATDLNTIEEVVYERGKLVDAIRASISIPGIFRPVADSGRTLIDGGLANPVPVDVLARTGVSRIIAVNTFPNAEMMRQYRQSLVKGVIKAVDKKRPMHETGALIDTPTSIIKLYMRFLNAVQSRSAQEACAKADVIITPSVPDGFWYDFYRPERYIRRGEQAAEAALPQIRELLGKSRA